MTHALPELDVVGSPTQWPLPSHESSVVHAD